jgi:tetratricopeptide (TPR) repeat protein
MAWSHLLSRRLNLGSALRGSPRLDHYVFAFVFLLRLIVLARLSASAFLLPNSGDMQFYNDWARRILGGQWTDHHAFYGLPLYPYLLALLYKLFGYSPFLPGFLQAILDGGTAVLLYKLAVKIFGNPAPPGRPAVAGPENSARNFFKRYRGEFVGVLAALGWGFFLPEEAYSAILMPTAGLVFVFWFVVWQIVRRRDAPTSLGSLLLGVLIGFTAMGIATILFLVPLLFVALFFKWNWTGDTRSIWLAKGAAAALVFIGIGIGASPCWIHNYFIAKDPVFLSAHSGVNFWIGNNPVATGYPRFPPGLHAGQVAMLQDSITTAEEAAGRPLKRAEVSAYWSKKANAYIKENFGSWLKLILIKIRNFWNAFQYDDLSIITVLREQGVILPGLQFGLVAALAIPGLLLAGSRFPASRWVSAAVLLHMGSLLTVFVTERYRAAAVPGLLLGASFTIWELWESSARGKYRRAAICVAMLLAATWLVSVPQRDPGLWALDPYNSGWQALQSNDLRLAKKKLELAYAYVPENSEINFSLGNLHLAQGDHRRAKAFYAATLRLDPRHKGALNNLGVLALTEEQWSLAADFFARALEQDPRDAKVHYLLAQALFRSGNLEGAHNEIVKALELKPDQPEFTALRDEILRLKTPRNP